VERSVVVVPVREQRDGGLDAGGPAVERPAAPRRTTGRRAALPNGRAVVGGLLVATAAVGTYAAWASADDAPTTRYAVATRDVAVGEVLEAADLELVPMDAPSSIAAASFEDDDASLLVGQVTVAPLRRGDLVQRSAVVVPEDAGGGRQLSFPIDVSAALAGTLEVGERVDVLVTEGSDVGEATTEVVAEGATVARVLGADDDGGRLVVLLSVPDDTDLLALTTAARIGELTLVRTTPGS
jgi:Flp pilus assembly protein CpaB